LLAGAEPEELATAVVAAIRGSPGIALGDVIGANVTICLVALGVGAVISPLLFGAGFRYAVVGLPLGAIGAWIAWDGKVTRLEGAILVLNYIAYVAAIWVIERHTPALGEVGTVEAARQGRLKKTIGRDLFFVLAGVIAMALGATGLVEAARHISSAERLQTQLGLTLIGFATGFELVVLAWSAGRRGASEAVVAAVVGSFAYNMTMTLGAAALARPLLLHNTSVLHRPLAFMLAAFGFVILLAARRRRLSRTAGVLLLTAYPLFVILVFLCW
jgi:cation:H+ antiporter